MSEFGKLIRSYREKCRFHETGQPLTQAQLGELIGKELGMDLGYTAAAISEWERGKSVIHIKDRLVLLKLLKVLHQCGGLSTLAQANDLLETGDYRSLNEDERKQVFMEESSLVISRIQPLSLDKIEQVIVQVFPSDKQIISRKWVVVILAMLGIIIVILSRFVALSPSGYPSTTLKQANCSNKLNLLTNVKWNEVSALWKQVENGYILIENNPTTYYGKIETERIQANVDRYPTLYIHISKIDPSTGITIQTEGKNILENLTLRGDYTANIAKELDWQGVHFFTINIWISGEGQSAVFDMICIGAT